MIVVMKKKATDAQIDQVIEWIESVGYRTHPSRGVERSIIGAVGDERGKGQLKSVENLPGVEKVVPILKPYKLASREFSEADTVIPVGDMRIGGTSFVVMAGPCSVESEEQSSKKAGRTLSGAGRSSRARRLTASRGWKKRA